MSRTFVRVELVGSDGAAESLFATAMVELGFTQTITGRKTGKAVCLPTGMHLIEQITPVEALGLTRQAARKANVEARIFCVPVAGRVSFGNLQLLDATT